MDDEPMWDVDRVVAPTLNPAITIPKTTNEFAIKGNHLTLVKGNQFDVRIKTDPHKHIHEFLDNDAITMKMDAQYKEIQSRTKCNHCRGNHSTTRCNDDDSPMSHEEEAKCDNRDLSMLKWFTYVHDVILEVNGYLILCAYEFGVKYSICSRVVIKEVKDVLHALLRQFLVFKS
ncbi:hypothetical protein Tco_0053165 [Tanacetum coccineum]